MAAAARVEEEFFVFLLLSCFFFLCSFISLPPSLSHLSRCINFCHQFALLAVVTLGEVVAKLTPTQANHLSLHSLPLSSPHSFSSPPFIHHTSSPRQLLHTSSTGHLMDRVTTFSLSLFLTHFYYFSIASFLCIIKSCNQTNNLSGEGMTSCIIKFHSK